MFIFDGMDNIKFSHQYKNFAELIYDVDKIKKHYSKHGFVVEYEVYPSSILVNYEVSKKRPSIQG